MKKGKSVAAKKEKSNTRKDTRNDIRSNVSRFVLLALALIVILALAIWLIISLFTDNEEKTRYAFLNEGTLYETVTSDLLIVRDETEVVAQNDGIFLPLAHEGEKLGKGEIFALVLPQSAADLAASYQQTRQEILEHSLLVSGETVQLNSRLDLSQKLIQEAVSELRASVLNSDLATLTQARKELETALRERSVLLRPETIDDPELNALLNKEASFLRQLIEQTPPEGILSSSSPCWISFTCFRPSAGLTAEGIAGLDAAQVRELVADLEFYQTSKKQEQTVQRGEAVARKINDMEYSLYTFLPEGETLPEAEESGIYLSDRDLLLDDFEIVPLEGADDILVLQTTSAFEEFLDVPILHDVDLIGRSHSGLKVPLQSLYDYSETDNIAKLLKIKDGVSTEVIVFVRAQDDTHAIVEGRSGDSEAPLVNELYVLNPWTNEPGSLLE